MRKGLTTLVCATWLGSSVLGPRPVLAYASSKGPDAGSKKALRLGLYDLSVRGEVSDPDKKRLSESLESGLQSAGTAPVSINSKYDPTTCRTVECRQKVAKQSGTDFLIQATVSVNGRDYGIQLEAVDGRTGEVVAERTTTCDICGVTEAANMLEESASQLREKLDQLDQVGELRVATEPPGARVYVDGKFRGVSPVLLHLTPGKHELEVSKEGYMSAKRSFSLVGGVRERQAFVLNEKVSISDRQRTWAWVSLGTGVAAIAGGAVLLGMHGVQDKRDCSPDAGTQDARGNCRYILDFRWVGFGATAAGAALAGWGATMLWGVPSARSKRKAATLPRRRQRVRLNIGLTRFSLDGTF